MLKNIWQKIKRNHLLLMTLCCLAPIVLIIGFLFLFKEGSNYWTWLIILLCPFLHILMMRGHKYDSACEKESDKELRGETEYKCPECGFKYEEKEWAEKCEAWCKEHRSRNLEIIKHAINKGREKEEVIKN